MRPRTLSELLRLPIRTGGIELARPVRPLIDPSRKLLGFEVVGRDGVHRFLPLAAVEVAEDELRVSTALVFLEDRALDYYRSHTRSRAELGLVEPWVDEDGNVFETRSAA